MQPYSAFSSLTVDLPSFQFSSCKALRNDPSSSLSIRICVISGSKVIYTSSSFGISAFKYAVLMSNLRNFLPSDTPVEMMLNTDEVATVGEEVCSDEYIDLSCIWPPATSRALIFRRLPFASLLSLTKQLILIIFFL